MRRIGRVSDIPYLEGRTADLDGTRVAVFHTETGFVAIGAECPHEGGPLADGIVAGGCVTCPLHGLRFDLDTGAAVGGEERVRTYEVVERAGELWLAVGALVEAA